jgi:hypothetical protein
LTDEPAVTSYILTLSPTFSTQEYFFDPEEYWIETGEDPLRMPTRNLCDVIDHMFQSDTPALAKYLSEAEVHAGINIGVLDIGLGLKVQLMEMMRALGMLSTIRNSHALIVVKGYADGQHGPWIRTLNPDFPYRQIRVLKPPRHASAATTYFARDSVITIQNDQYNNEILPDMRAEFVRQELVLPFLQYCEKARPEVRILKGYEFSKPDHPENRKVQVFVYIIPDD